MLFEDNHHTRTIAIMHFNITSLCLLALASFGFTSSLGPDSSIACDCSPLSQSDDTILPHDKPTVPDGGLPPGALGLPAGLPHLASPHRSRDANGGPVARNPSCIPPSQPDRKVQAYPNKRPKQEEHPTVPTTEDLSHEAHGKSASLLQELPGKLSVHEVIKDL